MWQDQKTLELRHKASLGALEDLTEWKVSPGPWYWVLSPGNNWESQTLSVMSIQAITNCGEVASSLP